MATIGHRAEQLFILLAHLVLLAWMLYVLSQGGTMTTSTLLIHFSGMALYGGPLIAFCAWRGRRGKR